MIEQLLAKEYGNGRKLKEPTVNDRLGLLRFFACHTFEDIKPTQFFGYLQKVSNDQFRELFESEEKPIKKEMIQLREAIARDLLVMELEKVENIVARETFLSFCLSDSEVLNYTWQASELLEVKTDTYLLHKCFETLLDEEAKRIEKFLLKMKDADKVYEQKNDKNAQKQFQYLALYRVALNQLSETEQIELALTDFEDHEKAKALRLDEFIRRKNAYLIKKSLEK